MLEIRVDGMTCGHCEKAVRGAIARVAPDLRVEVDRAAGLVRVDGDAPEAALHAAIREAGYEIRP